LRSAEANRETTSWHLVSDGAGFDDQSGRMPAVTLVMAASKYTFNRVFCGLRISWPNQLWT